MNEITAATENWLESNQPSEPGPLRSIAQAIDTMTNVQAWDLKVMRQDLAKIEADIPAGKTSSRNNRSRLNHMLEENGGAEKIINDLRHLARTIYALVPEQPQPYMHWCDRTKHSIKPDVVEWHKKDCFVCSGEPEGRHGTREVEYHFIGAERRETVKEVTERLNAVRVAQDIEHLNAIRVAGSQRQAARLESPRCRRPPAAVRRDERREDPGRCPPGRPERSGQRLVPEVLALLPAVPAGGDRRDGRDGPRRERRHRGPLECLGGVVLRTPARLPRRVAAVSLRSTKTNFIWDNRRADRKTLPAVMTGSGFTTHMQCQGRSGRRFGAGPVSTVAIPEQAQTIRSGPFFMP